MCLLSFNIKLYTVHTLLINKTEAQTVAQANMPSIPKWHLGFMKKTKLPQSNAVCSICAFIVISKRIFEVALLKMDLPVVVTHDWGFRCRPRTFIDSCNTKIREEGS